MQIIFAVTVLAPCVTLEKAAGETEEPPVSGKLTVEVGLPGQGKGFTVVQTIDDSHR